MLSLPRPISLPTVFERTGTLADSLTVCNLRSRLRRTPRPPIGATRCDPDWNCDGQFPASANMCTCHRASPAVDARASATCTAGVTPTCITFAKAPCALARSVYATVIAAYDSILTCAMCATCDRTPAQACSAAVAPLLRSIFV